jgi:2',3'-cyclic-nucleotide 2'-phosphodiesterase (5'-nucleotidase family)
MRLHDAIAVIILPLALLVSLSAGQSADDPAFAQTAWGSAVADAMRAHYGADAAFIDAGELATITSEQVTNEDFKRVSISSLPVVLASVTGDTVLQSVAYGLKYRPRKSNGFLQVSGLTVNATLDAGGHATVKDVLIAGKEIDPKATYRVATTKFLAGDGMSIGTPNAFKVADGSEADLASLLPAYLDTIAKLPDPAGRYVFVKSKR